MGTGTLGTSVRTAIKNFIDGLVNPKIGWNDETQLKNLQIAIFDEVEDYIDSLLAANTGMIAMTGDSSAPSGWLICNGSAVSRVTYSALFAKIGTTFGVGDGSTTFNLPDFRGIFPRGSGSNGTLTSTGGAVGTYQQDAMQRITGSNYSTVLSANSMVGSGAFTAAKLGTPSVEADNPAEGSEYTGFTFDSADSTSPNAAKTDDDETRPSNLTVNFIIKT